MTELDKLEQYVKNRGFDYERIDEEPETEFEKKYGINWHQILVYADRNNSKAKWDAICQYGSYGYKEGLLEVMGKWLLGNNDVKGYLTADEVISMVEEREKNESMDSKR